MRRFITLTTVAVVAIAIALGWGSWTDILGGRILYITIEKICQVTGKIDKQYNRETVTAGSGITGSDLGYPVQWKNKLYFLFGDTRDTGPDQVNPDAKGLDAVAVGPVDWDIDRRGCIPLEFKMDGTHFQPIKLTEISPDACDSLRVRLGALEAQLKESQPVPGDQHPPKPPPTKPPPNLNDLIRQIATTRDELNACTAQPLGLMETPISGFVSKDSLYAFFTLRDRSSRCLGGLGGCALSEDGGRTVLAQSTDDGVTFTKVADVSTGKFQWPVAIVRDIGTIPQLAGQNGFPPNFTGQVAVIFAAGREDYSFRHGYPFLAIVPLQDITEIGKWQYFSKILPDGKPVFKADESNANPLPPFGHEGGQASYHKCVGDLSVAYIEEWGKWAMLYACVDPPPNRGVFLRTADMPWGPWSDPKLIFDPAKGGYCDFMYRPVCPADKRNPADQGMVDKGELLTGGEYAPMLLPSYTRVEGNSTRLYFLMSTWNPYQVVLMRTAIEPPNLITRLTEIFRGTAGVE